MKLSKFEIVKVGPVFRDIQPPFSRCEVEIGVRDVNSRTNSIITLNLAMPEQGEETVKALHARILAEARRVIESAASLLDGHDVAALHTIVDADDKLRMANLGHNDPFE